MDSKLRATGINVTDQWTKRYQNSVVEAWSETKTMRRPEIKEAKEEAFVLLDALTRADALAVEGSCLHVAVAATHTFDNNLIDTAVQDNVNPVLKVWPSLRS